MDLYNHNRWRGSGARSESLVLSLEIKFPAYQLRFLKNFCGIRHIGGAGSNPSRTGKQVSGWDDLEISSVRGIMER